MAGRRGGPGPVRRQPSARCGHRPGQL